MGNLAFWRTHLRWAKAVLAKGASAILINCSPPESITQAVEKLVALGVEIGAMANGFVTTEPSRKHNC